MNNEREYCSRCKRTKKGCICKFTIPLTNDVPITILRHPSEIKKEKATVDLLRLSLSNCRVIDGENFDEDDVLIEGHRNILVYPCENESNINTTGLKSLSKVHLIFIDGTWKKAFKIFKLNPFLSDLTSVELHLDSDSPYKEIRKQRENGLSTLEAVGETIKLLQTDFEQEKLLEQFNSFLNHLKSFRS